MCVIVNIPCLSVMPPPMGCSNPSMCRHSRPSLPPPLLNLQVLHVRSISSWAPVCIGPYCQANTLGPGGGIALIAGQIGLQPASMTFPARIPRPSSAGRDSTPAVRYRDVVAVVMIVEFLVVVVRYARQYFNLWLRFLFVLAAATRQCKGDERVVVKDKACCFRVRY